MDLQNSLAHMRGKSVNVNGHRYLLDLNGMARDVAQEDAKKLLANREVWAVVTAKNAPQRKPPPTLAMVREAGYPEGAAREIVAAEEALAAGKTREEAALAGKAAREAWEATQPPPQPANPYGPAQTPPEPQGPKEAAPVTVSGEAPGQYDDGDDAAPVTEGEAEGEEETTGGDQVVADEDGSWPDPKVSMTLGQLRQIADAYEVPWTKRTGKPRLVKDIMQAMYPEGQ